MCAKVDEGVYSFVVIKVRSKSHKFPMKKKMKDDFKTKTIILSVHSYYWWCREGDKIVTFYFIPMYTQSDIIKLERVTCNRPGSFHFLSYYIPKSQTVNMYGCTYILEKLGQIQNSF